MGMGVGCGVWDVGCDYGSPFTSAGTGTGSLAVHIPNTNSD